jgi:hypothetical protein
VIDPVLLFREGGPFMYLLLLVFLASPAVVLAAFIVAFGRIRLPGVAWTAVATVPLLIGIAAGAQGLQLTASAIVTASLDMQGRLAANGMSVALYPVVAAGWGTAVVGPLLALALGVGSLLGARKGTWRPAAPLFGGLFVLAALLLFATQAFLVAFAVGTVGIAWMGATARVAEEQPARGTSIGTVFTVASVGAVALGGAFAYQAGGAAAVVLQASANASREMRAKITGAALEWLYPQLGLVALLGCALVLAGVAVVLLNRADARRVAFGVDVMGALTLAGILLLGGGVNVYLMTGLYDLTRPFDVERAPIVRASGITLPSAREGRPVFRLPTLHFGPDGPLLDGEPASPDGPPLAAVLIEADGSLAAAVVQAFAPRLAGGTAFLAVDGPAGMDQLPIRFADASSESTAGLLARPGQLRAIEKSGDRWIGGQMLLEPDELDVSMGQTVDVWPSGTMADLVAVVDHVQGRRGEVQWRTDAAPELHALPAGTDATPDAGDAEVLGQMDRSLVAAVVKRHRNQVRYCYERELVKEPTLEGRMVVKFVIGADGAVASASLTENTVNEAVGECVVGRFRRMRFPEPRGGGIVIVTYPFVFGS